MSEQQRIAMCWKCANVNTVKVGGGPVSCSTLTGCKLMTQEQWDESVKDSPMPSWEDCPLSKV